MPFTASRPSPCCGITSPRPSFYKLDIAALLLVLAAVLWGIKQRSGLTYLAHLEKVYQDGWQIHCVNWLRYMSIILAKLASIIQVAFFVSLIPIFSRPKFSDLRLPALAGVMISTAVYGNMLTVGVVHTLDLDRYRTGYVPALLLTLVIMVTAFYAVVAERWRAPEAADRGPTE